MTDWSISSCKSLDTLLLITCCFKGVICIRCVYSNGQVFEKALGTRLVKITEYSLLYESSVQKETVCFLSSRDFRSFVDVDGYNLINQILIQVDCQLLQAAKL